MTDELVESAAKALWQAESIRATDRPRRSEWQDEAEKTRENWRFMARACLSAIEADGMVIVPREPTEEMATAGCDALDKEIGNDEAVGLVMAATYKAMLAAAPRATSASVPPDGPAPASGGPSPKVCG